MKWDSPFTFCPLASFDERYWFPAGRNKAVGVGKHALWKCDMTNTEVDFYNSNAKTPWGNKRCLCEKWSRDARMRPRTESVVRGDGRCWFHATKVYYTSNNKTGQLSPALRLCFRIVGLSPFVNLPVVAEVRTSNQRAPAANTCRAPAARCSRNIACEIWSQTFPVLELPSFGLGDRHWTTQTGKIRPRGFQPFEEKDECIAGENVPERSCTYCRFCSSLAQPVWLLHGRCGLHTYLPSRAITHNATTQKHERSITKFNMFSDP